MSASGPSGPLVCDFSGGGGGGGSGPPAPPLDPRMGPDYV